MADDLVAAAEAEAARQVDCLGLDVGIALRTEKHIHLRRQQIALVRFDDNGQAARFQHDHGTDRIDPHAAHEVLREHGVEMEFAPLINLAQGFGGGDALVVAAVGRQRVIHVDDGGHLRQFADGVTGQMIGVAAAVAPLMVVQGDVEGYGAQLGRAAQDIVAIARMALDQRKFFRRQGTWFVQHAIGHQRLACVVQQAAQAGLVRGGAIDAPRAAKRHQQRAHADGVQEGVVVLVLDAQQADEGAGIAQNRFGNILHRVLHAVDLDGLAQADIGHHRAHQARCLPPHLRGARQFHAQRHARDHLRRRCGDLHQFAFRLGPRLRHGRRILHIEALAAVDHHVVDAGFHDLADFIVAAQQETVAHERMGHPVTAEVVDIHAHF